MPVFPETTVQRRPAIGGMDTVVDGGAVAHSEGTWSYIEQTLVENLHLANINVSHEGWKVGDYGFGTLANLAVAATLPAQVNAGSSTVDIGVPALAPYYDPNTVGVPQVTVEFWSMNAGSRVALVERRYCTGVTGSVLTLDGPLGQTHAAGALLIPCYQNFSTPRGTDLLEGGVYLVGHGDIVFGSQDRSEITEMISAGMTLAMRFKTTAEVGARSTAITIQWRRPVA